MGSHQGAGHCKGFDVILFFFFKMLSAMEEFRNLDRDIENNSKRWRKFVEAEVPDIVTYMRRF